MRKIIKCSDSPKIGDTRVIKYFAFLPIEFYNSKLGYLDKRWLETVEIKQERKQVFVGLEDGGNVELWVSIGFNN